MFRAFSCDLCNEYKSRCKSDLHQIEHWISLRLTPLHWNRFVLCNSRVEKTSLSLNPETMLSLKKLQWKNFYDDIKSCENMVFISLWSLLVFVIKPWVRGLCLIRNYHFFFFSALFWFLNNSDCIKIFFCKHTICLIILLCFALMSFFYDDSLINQN